MDSIDTQQLVSDEREYVDQVRKLIEGHMDALGNPHNASVQDPLNITFLIAFIGLVNTQLHRVWSNHYQFVVKYLEEKGESDQKILQIQEHLAWMEEQIDGINKSIVDLRQTK